MSTPRIHTYTYKSRTYQPAATLASYVHHVDTLAYTTSAATIAALLFFFFSFLFFFPLLLLPLPRLILLYLYIYSYHFVFFKIIFLLLFMPFYFSSLFLLFTLTCVQMRFRERLDICEYMSRIATINRFFANQ